MCLFSVLPQKKSGTCVKSTLNVPGTGLEPAHLAALAPETSASTIPPPGHLTAKLQFWLEKSQY